MLTEKIIVDKNMDGKFAKVSSINDMKMIDVRGYLELKTKIKFKCSGIIEIVDDESFRLVTKGDNLIFKFVEIEGVRTFMQTNKESRFIIGEIETYNEKFNMVDVFTLYDKKGYNPYLKLAWQYLKGDFSTGTMAYSFNQRFKFVFREKCPMCNAQLFPHEKVGISCPNGCGEVTR